MATSDHGTVRAVLKALTDSGIPFSLLHALPNEAEGLTDVDIVIGCAVNETSVRAIQSSVFGPCGLRLVVCWPYDHEAMGLFATDGVGDHGIHLDIVHDSRAYGRLGLVFPRMLEGAKHSRAGWPIVSAEDQLLYKLRKSHWKGDHRRFISLVEAAHSDGMTDRVIARAQEVMRARAATNLISAIRKPVDLPRYKKPAVHYAVSVTRLARRTVHPAGLWVHLIDDSASTARELASLFDETLLQVAVIRHDQLTVGNLMRAAGVRWRAGMVITWGDRLPAFAASFPECTLVPGYRPVEGVARIVTDALAQRGC